MSAEMGGRAIYQGANYGWQRHLEALERLVKRLNS